MKVHIHKLLDNIEDSSVELEEQNVVSSERIKELTKMKIANTGNRKKSSKKGVVTVCIAVAVVAALGATAFAAFGGGLEYLTFNKGDGEANSEQSVIAESDIKTSDDYFQYVSQFEFISLQGYCDTPEFLAAQEWRKFEDNYDTDWKILDEVGNNTAEWDEKYGAYGVYSQEMADKVDEIAEKYGLTLHNSRPDDVDNDELEARFGKVMDDAILMGYCYDDGTFHVDGEYNEYGFQLGRVVKGTFDIVYLNIGSSSSYEQWQYTTDDGYNVTLCLSNDKALIIADLDGSFVTVNVMLRFSPKTMDKAQLEDMADHINFGVL